MCNYASGTFLLAMVCLAHALPGRQPQKEVLMLEELPLYVIATQPAGLADQYDGEPIMVKGKQPLTVVFSRPVVNLMGDPNSQTKAVFFFEPEIPGNFTWSSSFIVHFSPEQNWPLENVLKLRWYSSISSFDGANLIRDTDTDGIVELITPNLTLSLELVVLDQSRKSTDSGWDANVGTPLDILPEVPPNARVFLGFSYPVSLKSLRDHFQVYQDEQPVDLGLKVSTCNMAGAPDSQIQDPNFVEQETSCIIVTFENTQPGARFTLALGAGTKISNNSGLLVDDLSVSFGGLRSFTIPFVEQPIMGFFNITHSALNVWLPHGLSEGNTIADLKQQMSIVTNKTGEEVDFDLSLRGRSICRLVADFVPGESYRIQVAPSSSVLDEYGQPLQQSSLILYTDPVEPLFEPLKPRAQK